MLDKRSYTRMLMVAVIVFFITFIVSFAFMLFTDTQAVGDKPTSISNKEKQTLPVSAQTIIDEPCIKAYTRIMVSVIDETGKRMDTKLIDPKTLLGCTKQDVLDKFKGYEVERFDEEEVFLKKYTKSLSVFPTYVLGIKENKICIIEQTDQRNYIPLPLVATDYSKQTYSRLLKQDIVVSEAEKQKLIQEPNYIDSILQSYDQED